MNNTPLIYPGKLVDRTHSFSSDTIYGPTEKDRFKLETEFSGQTENGYYYSQKKFSAPEHGGTHLDAPIHFFKEGIQLNKYPHFLKKIWPKEREFQQLYF